MRPRHALGLLAALALGAAQVLRPLPARRRQVFPPPADPAPAPTPVQVELARHWPGLTPEDAARVALGWPLHWPLFSKDYVQ